MRTSKRREMRWGPGRVAVVTAIAAVSLLSVACGAGSGPGDVIDRETFITTWIDLRRTAMESTDGGLDDRSREEVLQRQGVTEEDLLAFADTHGRDVEFLRALWTEVEARMDSLSTTAGDPDGAVGSGDGARTPDSERGPGSGA